MHIWEVGKKQYEIQRIDSGVFHLTDSTFRKREQRKLRKGNYQRNNTRNPMK